MVLTDEISTSAPQFDAISLFTKTQTKAASINEIDNYAALGSLKALSPSNTKESAPLYIIAVLDKSSSMASARKIDMLKETMIKLIGKLRACDKLGIVSYSNSVDIDLAPLNMDEEGILKAKATVNELTPRGCTNLSGGLLEGLRLIPKDLPDGTVVTTLLLTDGLANVGLKSTSGITEMITHLWEKSDGPKRSTVYTFGYGNDHDAAMLKGIATATEGMYYYIENEDKIADSFADVLGGLFSVVAQNITITIEAQNGAKITDVITEYSYTTVEPSIKYRIQLADIQSEESRDIPITFSLPACETGEFSFAKFEIDYFDVLTQKSESRTSTISVNRLPVEELPEEIADATIEQHIDRITTCRKLKEAQELAEKNNLEGARTVLSSQLSTLRSRATSNEPLMARLSCDVMTTLSNFSTETTFKSKGSKVASNNYLMHAKQRAAPQCHKMEKKASYTYVTKKRVSSLNSFHNRTDTIDTE